MDWFERGKYLGHEAMKRARLSAATAEDHRLVQIILHVTVTRDEDNAYASVKDLVDGLKVRHARRVKGLTAEMTDMRGAGLVWDDRKPWLQLVVDQQDVEHRKEQRTVVRVWRA